MTDTPMFGDPIGPWHRKFAWAPINTIDMGYRWFQFVWRRRIQKHYYLDGGGDFWWQYKASVLE